jgi:prepilin-type N-terminal cleavage/methylation domain-containing protein
MTVKKKARGFTLIEMIAAIALMGTLAALTSIGIARVFEGYVSTKDNADTSLNAQIALNRLMKEFSSIEAVTSGTQTSITYTYNKNGVSIPNRRVSWAGTATAPLLLGSNVWTVVYYSVDGTVSLSNTGTAYTSLVSRGNVLVENVSDFALTYHTSYSDAGDNTWDGTEKMIGITLKLKGASNVVSAFSIRVVPRNL